MTKKLIAFFSASGNTQTVAKKMANVSGIDLYEIKPTVPYEKKDLNWMNPLSRSTKEMKGKAPHPDIITDDINIADYDIIFLGFPIWWYTAPAVIHSFLEAHDFKGKTIVLFATSGVSRFGKAAGNIQQSAPESTILEGEMFNGSYSDEKLKTFTQKY